MSTDGASAVTKTVGQVLSEGTEVVKTLTGLDLSALLGAAAGTAFGAPADKSSKAIKVAPTE